MENIKESKRVIGLDILRILAMLMVLLLHYLSKGGLLKQQNTEFLLNKIYWILETLSIVAVNCYVLISGYFLIKSKFKIKKFFKLWGEVIFYSISIYIIITLFGLKQFNIKEALTSCMPVITKQYWFINAYLVMYLLSPFINKLIINLEKEELKKLIIILLITFSAMSILPGEMLLDSTEGYGIIWFICLYIIAAYIRLYVEKNNKNNKYLLFYTLLGILLAIIIFITKYVCKKIGIEDKSGKFLQYNNIIVAFESIFLFLYFREINIKSEKIIKYIKIIAPLTFAVYIIHEQSILRTVLYNKILHTDICYHNPYGLLIVICNVILIFIVCVLIEYVRKKITCFIVEKVIRKNKVKLQEENMK